MPAEVPVFRLESAFFNPTAFGDRSEAASAGCPFGGSPCESPCTPWRHTGSSNVQHQHQGRSCLNDQWIHRPGTDGTCGGGSQTCLGGRSASSAGRWGTPSPHSPTLASVSLHDILDLSTPSVRLMFQVVGAMADSNEHW